MATMTVLDSTGTTVTIEKPSSPGQAAMAASKPVVIASDQSAVPVSLAALPALAAGANVVGGVTQSGTWNITNVSGTISLPTGAATAAKQPALGTAGTPSADVITVQGVAAGTALTVGGTSAVVGGSITRPADTTAYAIGDLVANSTTAGSVTPIACAVARVNAGTAVIRRLRLSTTKTALAGTEVFRIHLFKTSPTVTNGDNGAFSATGIASIALGYFDITMTSAAAYSDGAKGYVPCDVVAQAAAATTNIFALIEARSAYTPISGEVFTLALEVLQD